MTTANELLHHYMNGNVSVKLYEDGTKIRSWYGSEDVQFPESIDIKITNQCDVGCAFCHEKSVPSGVHGRIDRLSDKLLILPKGIELAIGGGNPMSHPDLGDFLAFAGFSGFVSNLTMNQVHIKQYVDKLHFLLYNKLIRGLGISVNGVYYDAIDELYKQNHHIVFHVIAGVHPVNIIDKLKDRYKNPRILILGYKQWGFGEQYYDEGVEKTIRSWRNKVPLFLDNTRLAFDNLAVEQLAIKNWLTPEQWNEKYQGDDFTHSMYIDAVEGKYAPTSRSGERVDWDVDIKTYWRQTHGN